MRFNEERNKEKSEGLDKQIEEFKKTNATTPFKKVLKKGHLFLIVDVGGSLLPFYQRRHARQLGWEDKDMTIRNALYCGVIPGMMYFIANQHFGDNMPNFIERVFSGYASTLMFAQNVGRATLAQILNRPIPSISLMAAFGNAGYFIADTVKKYRNGEIFWI